MGRCERTSELTTLQTRPKSASSTTNTATTWTNVSTSRYLTRAAITPPPRANSPQVVDLFSNHPDTIVEFLGGRYRGKEGVRRLYINRFQNTFVNGRNGPVHGFLLDHAMLQDIIDVDPSGNRAYGRWRALMSAGAHASIADTHPRGRDAQGRPRQWWEGGVYENEYIKEDGVWKIFKYRYFAFWHGEFGSGWAETQPNYVPFAKTTFPEDPNGPDELVGQKLLWPDTRVIPFHYTHPVTGEQVEEDDLRAPGYGAGVESAEPALSLEER